MNLSVNFRCKQIQVSVLFGKKYRGVLGWLEIKHSSLKLYKLNVVDSLGKVLRKLFLKKIMEIQILTNTFGLCCKYPFETSVATDERKLYKEAYVPIRLTHSKVYHKSWTQNP